MTATLKKIATAAKVTQTVAHIDFAEHWTPKYGFSCDIEFKGQNGETLYRADGPSQTNAYGKLTPARCLSLAMYDAGRRAARGDFNARYDAQQEIKFMRQMDLSNAVVRKFRYKHM